ALGAEEDVPKYRKAAAGGDRPTRDPETACQVLLETCDLHAPSPSVPKRYLFISSTSGSGVDDAAFEMLFVLADDAACGSAHLIAPSATWTDRGPSVDRRRELDGQ